MSSVVSTVMLWGTILHVHVLRSVAVTTISSSVSRFSPARLLGIGPAGLAHSAAETASASIERELVGSATGGVTYHWSRDYSGRDSLSCHPPKNPTRQPQ